MPQGANDRGVQMSNLPEQQIHLGAIEKSVFVLKCQQQLGERLSLMSCQG